MQPRPSWCLVVPEIDREGAVRRIDKESSTRSQHAQQLGEERAALRIAIRQHADRVSIGNVLLNSDVLDDAGRKYDIEKTVGEGELHSAGDREVIAMRALAPLPSPQEREVD